MDNNNTTIAVIGGTDYEGESFSTMRIFGSTDDAMVYAQEVLTNHFDYALLTSVNTDGSLELNDVKQITANETSVIDIDY